MKTHQIAASLALCGLAIACNASADNILTSPPVSINAPSPEVNRAVWCQAQSLSAKKDFNVVSATMLGDNGTIVQEISGTISPYKTLWLSGATGGSGTVYCRFTVKNKKMVRGYIVVQDEPIALVGSTPSYKHTVMSMEAK